MFTPHLLGMNYTSIKQLVLVVTASWAFTFLLDSLAVHWSGYVRGHTDTKRFTGAAETGVSLQILPLETLSAWFPLSLSLSPSA